MEKPKKTPKFRKAKKTGRPTHITQELIDQIKNAILVGNYFETSCAMAGLPSPTAYDWLKWGAKSTEPDNLYRIFSETVKKAQAEAEARDVMVIEMAAHGTPAVYEPDQKDANGNIVKKGRILRAESPRTWQAAAWRLERKHAKRWARVEHLRHTGKDGGPIAVTFVDFIRALEDKKTDDQEEDENDL